jgi:hypothetical protein
MEWQRVYSRTIFLAACMSTLFVGGASSQSVTCLAGDGTHPGGGNPASGSSWGVDCEDPNREAYAWVSCSNGKSPNCFGRYRATADGTGVVCLDAPGVQSPTSPEYCQRYGGGVIVGCAAALQGPQETTAVAIDGEPHTVAFPKSSFVLNRMEDGEGDVSFLMEEWAIIGPSIQAGETRPRLKVLMASSPAFAAAKTRDLELSARVSQKGNETVDAKSGETLLVVEAPVHPHNSRFAPTPTLELADTKVPPGMSPTDVLIRADFSENEDSTRQLQVLHSSGIVSQELMDLLKDRLKLDRGAMKRHRTIVFASVRIGDAVRVTNLTTVMPKCCCGGYRCI